MAIFIPSREFKVKTTLDAPINLNPVRLSKFLISEDFMLTCADNQIESTKTTQIKHTADHHRLLSRSISTSSESILSDLVETHHHHNEDLLKINMDDREWMYRHMRSGHLNPEFIVGKKVTNKAQVEGSICEAYLIDEITNFTSYYFGDDVQTIWNQVP
ncbi:hypothetical protein SADUNF_Sadunf06G0136900 [Salix dunnii]|uniref:DUF4218 domain-containing protein n=1 Tax=Salix dunnii TaxID=1413687 RepID=A0A835K278_9ROSI|nr:hypothetical protein SADUNF_Sadunf06G0136900 [Salix dunnii]